MIDDDSDEGYLWSGCDNSNCADNDDDSRRKKYTQKQIKLMHIQHVGFLDKAPLVVFAWCCCKICRDTATFPHIMKESHEPVTRWPRVREILTRLSGNLGSVVPWLLADNSLKRTNLCPRHWLLRPITWKRWRPDLCYRRWPLLVNNTTRDDQACVPDIDPTIVGR